MEFENYGPVDKLYSTVPTEAGIGVNGWFLLLGAIVIGFIGFSIGREYEKKRKGA